MTITERKASLVFRLANGGDGWVYFATAGPFVKIGWAFSPRKRLATLQTGCPYPMQLAAAVRGSKYLERDYHLRFILHRSGDSIEWFHLRGDLLDYIRHLRAGGTPMWEHGGFDTPEYPGDVGPFWDELDPPTEEDDAAWAAEVAAADRAYDEASGGAE